MNTDTMRWDPYWLRQGEDLRSFWTDRLALPSVKVLYVLAQGFDPRMCHGIKALSAMRNKATFDCHLVQFDEGADSPSRTLEESANRNLDELRGLLSPQDRVVEHTVRMWSEERLRRHRIASREAARVFSDMRDIGEYSDVIVDISSMPQSIYFPVIGKLLHILDAVGEWAEGVPNLHILVGECPAIDQAISEVGIDDEARYVPALGGDIDLESTAEKPVVWFPVLGEKQAVQLERVHELVKPEEICPVLPAPCIDPRRGDELLVEYREVLFDQWRVEPRNIIYASENNPFEAYRRISWAVDDYNEALAPIGGAKAVVSALSSKLLSVAALIATYDLRTRGLDMGLTLVESQGYSMMTAGSVAVAPEKIQLFDLWLVGECYIG